MCSFKQFNPVFLAFLALSACSTSRPADDRPDVTAERQDTAPQSAPKTSSDDALKAQLAESRAMVTTLNAKVDALEAKVKALTEQAQTKSVLSNQSMTQMAVTPSAGALSGLPVSASSAANDPESGFTNDDAVTVFRKAMVLYDSQNYPDAVVGFAGFLEKYPDHALAGSAQYYVGECYLKQKDYKQASIEFQRVLTSYDRSAHVSDTLKDLASAQDALQKSDDAAKSRQQLASLFPQSPAMSTDAVATEIKSGPVVAPPMNGTPPAAAPASATPPANAAPVVAPPMSGGPASTEGSDLPEKVVKLTDPSAPVAPIAKEQKISPIAPQPETPTSDTSSLDEPPPPTAPTKEGN